MAAGLIAVAYTAMGGLRAVVVTDLFQFVILMGGALLTVLLVTVRMGGFGWLPTRWAAHWDRQPLFSWNLGTRATVVGALMATFCDVRAARRAFLTNLLANLIVGVVLAVVGFALLGFFAVNQHLIPDGKNLIADADYLFPRYIANCLPVGLAGLVVAGMFAAAMSSLDSGINSIVTVVTRDFVARSRPQALPGEDTTDSTLRMAKYLVLAVGAAVVLLSSQMEQVPGNIVEVTNKTNGLFVGPLFGLFFMALFVRRATAFGTVGNGRRGGVRLRDRLHVRVLGQTDRSRALTEFPVDHPRGRGHTRCDGPDPEPCSHPRETRTHTRGPERPGGGAAAAPVRVSHGLGADHCEGPEVGQFRLTATRSRQHCRWLRLVSNHGWGRSLARSPPSVLWYRTPNRHASPAAGVPVARHCRSMPSVRQ
jgi:hypothetical protein